MMCASTYYINFTFLNFKKILSVHEVKHKRNYETDLFFLCGISFFTDLDDKI